MSPGDHVLVRYAITYDAMFSSHIVLVRVHDQLWFSETRSTSAQPQERPVFRSLVSRNSILLKDLDPGEPPSRRIMALAD